MYVIETSIEFRGRYKGTDTYYTFGCSISVQSLDNGKGIPVLELTSILQDCIPPQTNLSLLNLDPKPTLENLSEYLYKRLRATLNSRSIVCNVESVYLTPKHMADTTITYKL